MTNNTVCKGFWSPAGSGMIQLANTKENKSNSVQFIIPQFLNTCQMILWEGL